MEDKRTLENINDQIRSLEKNSQGTLENMTSIEMLLTSDNNSRAKSPEVAERFSQLKSKIEEAINETHEIATMLNRENNK